LPAHNSYYSIKRLALARASSRYRAPKTSSLHVPRVASARSLVRQSLRDVLPYRGGQTHRVSDSGSYGPAWYRRVEHRASRLPDRLLLGARALVVSLETISPSSASGADGPGLDQAATWSLAAHSVRCPCSS